MGNVPAFLLTLLVACTVVVYAQRTENMCGQEQNNVLLSSSIPLK
jgi:hypothetical protein